MTGRAVSHSLLVCAATERELAAWPQSVRAETLLSGVGIPQALATLLRRLESAKRPALVVNIGIAGAYPGSGIAIGDIVLGGSETYGDIGFELPEAPGYAPLTDLPFGTAYRDALPLVQPPWLAAAQPPGASGDAVADPFPYRVHADAAGCTVNCCTGTEATGERRSRLYRAVFETMEGAAVAQAGALLGIPVCEVRAISNIAARRDMRPANIQAALRSLTHYLEACAAQG